MNCCDASKSQIVSSPVYKNQIPFDNFNDIFSLVFKKHPTGCFISQYFLMKYMFLEMRKYVTVFNATTEIYSNLSMSQKLFVFMSL